MRGNLDPKYSDPQRQIQTYWWLVEQTTRLAVQTGVDKINAKVTNTDVDRHADNFIFQLVQVSNLFMEPTLLVDIALRAGNDMANGKKVSLSLRPRRSASAALSSAELVEQIVAANQKSNTLSALARDRRLMAVVLLWTGFEATLKDLWFTAVAAQPAKAHAAAINARQQRHVRAPLAVGATGPEIAKWAGLHHRTAAGLHEAFSVLLGPQDPVLDRFEAWVGAHLTEKVRHVVVHNGGRVDSEFIDKTGGGFGLPERAPVDVPNETLFAMMTNVCDLGLAMCTTTDRWVRSP